MSGYLEAEREYRMKKELFEKIMNENKVCCFTGHRIEKIKGIESDIRKKLEIEIENAIKDGFTIFISGMATGVDTWAAEEVLKVKENNKDIKLMCAVPFLGVENNRTLEQKRTFENIIHKADYVEYICDSISKDCFHARDEWMVNYSKRVIAVFNGTRGGTEYTINYAKQCNREIVMIYDGVNRMNFKKYNLCLEDRRDFDEFEEILTISSNDDGIPFMGGFCSTKDQLNKEINIGDSFDAFLQAALDPYADFEIYENADEYMKKSKENDVIESIFPSMDVTDEGELCYDEFAHIKGTIVDVMEYKEDDYLVKLCCQGYEFVCLIPGITKKVPKKGNIISGNFLMMLDLEKPY